MNTGYNHTKELEERIDVNSIHAIIGLLLISRPSAIFLKIISVIINPIYSSFLLSKLLNMFKIRFIHIIPKLLKGFPKEFDATPAVSMKPFVG